MLENSCMNLDLCFVLHLVGLALHSALALRPIAFIAWLMVTSS
jgi:hypothetical protein